MSYTAARTAEPALAARAAQPIATSSLRLSSSVSK